MFPDEAETVALYERACERLNASGIVQYEISNFARPGHRSRHNLRYWQRLPYFGFGVDAHSMLLAPTPSDPHRAVRLATPDSLDELLKLAGALPDGAPHLPQSADVGLERTFVSESQAIEETYFLGLRLNRGVRLQAIKEQFGAAAVDDYGDAIAAMVARELLLLEDGYLRLTPRGRLLSNEVFAAFLRD